MALRSHHTNYESIHLGRTYMQTFYKKPLGLWYDIDGSWKKWLQENEYKIGKNSFKLDINSEKILIIDSDKKLIQFNTDFSYIPDKIQGLIDVERRIDWDRVSKFYAGIEILLEREKYFMLDEYAWYRCWDVISGCIWDLSIIKSITKL